MHFVQRLRTIWSWLPAFRAVAETEHLPTAAQELGIVPSSLSRSVKQLEDELGVTLFDRTTKSLVLNEAGRTLLVAVREAMRIVDDALAAAVGDELRGSVGAVASRDLVHAILIPAGALLAESNPALTVSTSVARPDETVEMLQRGDADAAILFQPPSPHADLHAAELVTWSRSVFARIGHRLGSTPYRCVVVGSPGDHVDDGWPSSHERVIAAWAPDELAALALCLRSDLVTVAFDAIVRYVPSCEQLVRLPVDGITPCVLHLVHRRAVGRHRRTDVLVAAIRAAATDR